MRRRALGRKLGLAVFAALSGALAFSLLTDAGRQTREAMSLLPEADQVLFWTGLRIDQVALSGQRFTPDSDIFDALDLANARSLLTFHSNAARGRIEALPWIETASITREIPGALEIRVTERKPTALGLQRLFGQKVIVVSGQTGEGIDDLWLRVVRALAQPAARPAGEDAADGEQSGDFHPADVFDQGAMT